MKPADMLKLFRDVHALPDLEGAGHYTHPFLFAIFMAYDLAKMDGNAKIPSPLALAIENARRMLGDCAPVASPYAERRAQHRGELELSVDGRMIRPGE